VLPVRVGRLEVVPRGNALGFPIQTLAG